MSDPPDNAAPTKTREDEREREEKTDPRSGSPQQQTKNPQDHSAKWPGGGPKGEDEA